jgi:hypothetical protein
MLWPAPEPPYMETMFYRGYVLDVSSQQFLVTAPNGETATFSAATSARAWIRRHRAATR